MERDVSDRLARDPLTDRALTELDPARETLLWWVALGRTVGAFVLRVLYRSDPAPPRGGEGTGRRRISG